jgi:hypothetical protein
MRPYLKKYPTQKRDGKWFKCSEHLPSKHEVLKSKPQCHITKQNKTKQNKKKKTQTPILSPKNLNKLRSKTKKGIQISFRRFSVSHFWSKLQTTQQEREMHP